MISRLQWCQCINITALTRNMRSLKEKRQHDYEIKMTMTYLLPFKQNDSQKVNVLLWPVSTKGFIISTQSFLKVRFRVFIEGRKSGTARGGDRCTKEQRRERSCFYNDIVRLVFYPLVPSTLSFCQLCHLLRMAWRKVSVQGQWEIRTYSRGTERKTRIPKMISTMHVLKENSDNNCG